MKEEKRFYITHQLELLFWLIIVCIIVFFSVFAHIRYEHTNNDYEIFMPDVDGLIVGSPVRMMGIEVGNVTKIKPTSGELYVKFVIHDDSIKIPQGTVATVEFSGMAGSKSLELYLPDKTTYIDKDVPIIRADSPKRLHDAMGLLNNMYRKLTSIIYTSSSFSQKVKDEILTLPKTSQKEDIGSFIIYSDKMLDDAQAKVDDFGQKLKKIKNGEEKNGK